jgi:hypothetical protein
MYIFPSFRVNAKEKARFRESEHRKADVSARRARRRNRNRPSSEVSSIASSAGFLALGSSRGKAFSCLSTMT